MTRSMSYSRDFKIATAMAANRHTSARLNTTFTADTAALSAAGLNASCGTNANGMAAATTSGTAAMIHFSCSRSSPEDRAYRTAIAAAPAIRAAGTKMNAAVCVPGYQPSLSLLNGSAQTRQARSPKATAYSVNTAATNHAAGRHRGERSRPVGNSRSMKAKLAAGITETQFTNHAAARAPGSDPGAATSPPREYRSAKKARPTTRPV